MKGHFRQKKWEKWYIAELTEQLNETTFQVKYLADGDTDTIDMDPKLKTPVRLINNKWEPIIAKWVSKEHSQASEPS